MALLPLLVVAWQALLVLAGNGALVALLFFIIAGLAIGQTLGGPEQGDRTALALPTASRLPGLAIAIANANFPIQARLVSGAVLIYLRLLLFIPYNHWRRVAVDGSINAATMPVHPELPR